MPMILVDGVSESAAGIEARGPGEYILVLVPAQNQVAKLNDGSVTLAAEFRW